jgi:hypothetical protein
MALKFLSPIKKEALRFAAGDSTQTNKHKNYLVQVYALFYHFYKFSSKNYALTETKVLNTPVKSNYSRVSRRKSVCDFLHSVSGFGTQIRIGMPPTAKFHVPVNAQVWALTSM